MQCMYAHIPNELLFLGAIDRCVSVVPVHKTADKYCEMAPIMTICTYFSAKTAEHTTTTAAIIISNMINERRKTGVNSDV
jgi:hypothetical protein